MSSGTALRLCLGLMLGLWLPAALAAPALPEAAIPHQKFVLDNGLTLIVHEDRKAPIVAVNVWYQVGSRDEAPGRTGFAHLFEHLMFQGSEHHNDEYFRPLEEAGATEANGTTSEDRTNYFANVPTPALDLALWLESDRMGHMLGAVNQAKLDEQRGVVKNEKRQRENAPYGRVWELIPANTYPAGHPYSWSVIGSMQDLDAAKLEDVHDWFRRYYGAANAVIAIAGDISPAEAKAKVEKYFGHIPSGPPVPRQQVWVARMQGEHRQSLQDRVPQARVYKVWNVAERNHDDATLLQLAGELLAGGKNSRLYERLVYRDQIATDVVAALDARAIGSQFILWATARPGVELAKVEQAVNEELARFLREGPTTAELERVRTGLLADFLRGIERIGGFGGKSDILASSQVFGGSPDAYLRDLALIRRAGADDVRRAARAWLADGVYVLEVQPYPEHVTSAPQADRKRLPPPGPAPDLRLPAFQRLQLGNGLRVVLAERHETPVVELSLIADAGYAADSLATPGTASLALDMLDEGTRSRSALEISAELERLGARLGSGASLDSSVLSLSAISSLLDPALAIYSEVLRQPAFPENELQRLKQQRLAAIRQEKAQPVSLALRTLPPLLYGDRHAYGIPLTGSGTEAAVEAMTVADLRRFHETWIRPDNATLVVVGDITAEKLRPLLEKHLGGWRAPAGAAPRKNLQPVALPAAPRIFLLNRSDSEQSLVIAGQVAPPFEARSQAALETLNAILGGMFTSRINMNLREDKHWSYGARSLLMDARAQRPFVVYAQVQADKTAESLREILGEIQRIGGKSAPTAAELAAARNNLTRKLPGQHETAGAVATTIGKSVVYGLPDDYFSTYVSRVQGLQAADLRQAADLLLHPQALTWVVVGDLSRIEQPLRALGLGEVRVLDHDGRVLR